MSRLSPHSTIDFSLFTVDQILQLLTIDAGAAATNDAKRVLAMAIQYYDRVAKAYPR